MKKPVSLRKGQTFRYCFECEQNRIFRYDYTIKHSYCASCGRSSQFSSRPIEEGTFQSHKKICEVVYKFLEEDKKDITKGFGHQYFKTLIKKIMKESKKIVPYNYKEVQKK